MGVRLGIGHAFVEQPAVQFFQAPDPQPGCEEPLSDEADLVLDLPLLPAGGRGAGNGIDQEVAAHLQEAPIVVPFLAAEDRLHRRLHVVVNSARAGTLEEGEGPIVRVEHHLLALAHVGTDEHHPAVAKPDMGDLHGDRDASDHHDLVAPVELVGFTRIVGKRDIGLCRHRPSGLRPGPGIAADGIIAALVTNRPKFLEDADQGEPLARRLVRVALQKLVQLLLATGRSVASADGRARR